MTIDAFLEAQPERPPWFSRFEAKIQKSPDGCWNWIASLDKGGYGQFMLAAHRLRRAHRLSYEVNIGPIPDGLFLDHVCRNRACVNPAHLRPVTPRVNALQNSASLCAERAARNSCLKGHRYDEVNTYWYRGYRACRACSREGARRRAAPANVANKDKVACVHGHAYSERNTLYVRDKKGRISRHCRTCTNAGRRVNHD